MQHIQVDQAKMQLHDHPPVHMDQGSTLAVHSDTGLTDVSAAFIPMEVNKCFLFKAIDGPNWNARAET